MMSNLSKPASNDANRIIAIPAFTDNYIWLITNGHEAIVVDPGQAEPVLKALATYQLKLITILLTHHHQDHVGGVMELIEATHAHVYGPAGEKLPFCDTALTEGDQVSNEVLGLNLSVLDVPGHTAGHIAYYGHFNNNPILFCGDTLFAAGCGRLFEGTAAQMTTSLAKFAALPSDTQVFCAHEYTLSNMRWAAEVEPDNKALHSWQKTASEQRSQAIPTLPSTIRQELACNPFMRVQHPDVVQAATIWSKRERLTPVEVFAALREWKNNFR
jgi:hydroxyacylglutathione hydrolase